MNLTDFLAASTDPNFSSFDSETERCLWVALVKGRDQAHTFVEDLPEPGASWIHAMLHRDEGDHWNAAYWYRRAGKKAPADEISFEQEWLQITKSLIED